MKATALIAAGALGILAAACSPSKSAPPAAEKGAPASATPAAATAPAAPDGHVWSFWQTEEGSHLSYAVPESDDTANYFVCQTGTGTLQASVWADHAIPGEPSAEARTEMTQLTLVSGATSRSYEAVAEGEEMYGGAQVTAMNVGLNDPVIREFARTGAIQMKAYGETTKMPAVKLSDVKQLLDACKKAD